MKSLFEKNTDAESGVVFFTSPKLEDKNTRHFFSSRIGGESKEEFSSLNLGVYTDDDPDNVVENLIKVGEAAEMNLEELVYLNQTHSDRIYVVDDKNFEDIGGSDGDAIITKCRNVAIGVFTADCVPILVSDGKQGIIAAIHAGWKGTEAHIAAKVIRYMTEKMGCSPEDIHAAIGPSIGVCCFEVNDEVAEKFTYKTLENEKWHVDLVTENLKQLCGCGMLEENIDVCNLCTKCEQQLFYSYRRDNSNTGRMGAFIQLV